METKREGKKLVYNWRMKVVEWDIERSRVGWTTRLIALACAVFCAFTTWGLETQFANDHYTLTWIFIGFFFVVTAYRIVQFTYKHGENSSDYPYKYGIREAIMKLRGRNLLGWLNHKLVPFGDGYHDGQAWKIYSTYFAIAALWLVAYLVYAITFHFLTNPLMGGLFGFAILTYIAVNVLLRWRGNHKKETETSSPEFLEVANKQLTWELEEMRLAREKLLAAKKQADKGRGAELEELGELAALAAMLLKRVPAKRGDGNIGEARMIIEYMIRSILITDETRRQAALFRAGEKLDDPNRVRFCQTPKRA